MTLLLLLISTSIYSQNTESRYCFSDNAIDSIYYADRYSVYLGKQNEVLEKALSDSNKIKIEYNNQIKRYERKISTLETLNTNKDAIIKDYDKSLQNSKELYKIEKKKKLPVFIKGVLIGGGIVGGIILIN